MLKFLPTPVNTKLELGSKAKIYCRAEGDIEPQVTWTRTDGQMSSHVRDIEGILNFDGVQSGDIGNYTCVAESSQGKISATISVDVVGRW